ncbi:hypothetical protein CR513_52347, partial [Mucuna pruriens]
METIALQGLMTRGRMKKFQEVHKEMNIFKDQGGPNNDPIYGLLAFSLLRLHLGPKAQTSQGAHLEIEVRSLKASKSAMT